ncbi:hypothetical protein SUGI_0817530 [Cryptomeria japonica]|nr:hypothetical protein SUGI_0817530 [Cryptomeria japonica]
MVSEGGEFGRGSGSSRLLTGEQIVGAPIHGKGGQGKIRSWSDEADEAFPIEAIQNLTIGKQPTLKSTAWKDQTPGRPWKVDAPNPVVRGSRDPEPQRKSDASHPYTNSNLRPMNSQAWKKNGFSWSNDGWFRNAMLPASDLACNWKSILKPNPLQDITSRVDHAEAWQSTASARNQRSNLDRVGENEPWRRYKPLAHLVIHKPVRKTSRPTVILDDNKINLARSNLQDFCFFTKSGGGKWLRGNFEKWCRSQWGENINFNVLPNDCYLIEFMKNEDMFNAINKGPYTLDGIGVHIIDWKPNFNPRFHTLPENTVWLRLYNCPSDYWHIEIIKDICKELGTFVSVDDILEDRVWGSFIRICINSGQISKIPEEVKIIRAGEIWIQRIDREDQLHLCPKCFSREHIGLECKVSISILKSYACVQTKPIDMKLVKENTKKREANDVEQSSAASMKVVEKNNPVVYSPLVVSSHQQIHTANSKSAQALLNLLEDAKTLQKDIIIEFAATFSSVPNKVGDFSVMEDEIIPPLPVGPTAFDDPGKKGFTMGLEEGEIVSSASEWEEDVEPVANLIMDNTAKGFGKFESHINVPNFHPKSKRGHKSRKTMLIITSAASGQSKLNVKGLNALDKWRLIKRQIDETKGDIWRNEPLWFPDVLVSIGPEYILGDVLLPSMGLPLMVVFGLLPVGVSVSAARSLPIGVAVVYIGLLHFSPNR